LRSHLIDVFDGAKPARTGDLVRESQGMAPIPEDQRYGPNWRNFTVWFTPNLELSSVFTGTLAFTLGLGLWAGLAALVLGVILGALPVALLATWGPKTGMGQLPLARLPFGKSIALPAAVQWLSSIAWDALVGLFGAEAAQLLFHVPFAVGVVIVLLIEGLFGFFGYELIHQLEQWGAVLLGALFVVLSVAIVGKGHIALQGSVHGGTAIATFVLVTTIALSGSFSWASYAADYSRYQKKDTPTARVFWWTFAGLGASYIWMYAIGLAGARSLSHQTAAGVRSLLGGGVLGTVALIAILFGTVASNAMNDYSGSLAMQAGGVRLRRNWSAVLGTLCAFFLILWLHCGQTSGRFQNVLLFSAYWIAPFFAVVLIDWHARRGTVTHRQLLALLRFGSLPSGWPALAALVGGFGAMVPFMNTGLFVGPAATALGGADISFLVGFSVGAGLYEWLRRIGTDGSVSVSSSVGADDEMSSPAQTSGTRVGRRSAVERYDAR
jgi:NCS1 family nucleobase:cation symporter-1